MSLRKRDGIGISKQKQSILLSGEVALEEACRKTKNALDICYAVFKTRSQNCEKRLLDSSRLFVRLSALNNSTSNGRIQLKLDIGFFFSQKFFEKNLFSLKSDESNGTLRADQYTFLTISRSVLLGLRIALDKFVEKPRHTYCVLNRFPKIALFINQYLTISLFRKSRCL